MKKVFLILLSFGFAGVASAATLTANYVPKAASDNIITNGVIYDNGTNVGISTSTVNVLLTVGTGARTAGPVVAATDTVIKGAVQIDGSLYNPGMNVISAGYACWNATTKNFYIKATCP